jgi:hypothetical protein
VINAPPTDDAADPALPAPLLLRLIAVDGGGHGPPFQALHRPGLPEQAVAAVLTHPVLDARVPFEMSGQADAEQRARPRGAESILSFRDRRFLPFPPVPPPG